MPTTVVSSTRVTASGTAPTAKSSVPVVVATTAGEMSNTFFVNVAAASAVTVTISPTSATVRLRKTRQFTASVQNTADTSVICEWRDRREFDRRDGQFFGSLSRTCVGAHPLGRDRQCYVGGGSDEDRERIGDDSAIDVRALNISGATSASR